MTQQCLRLEDLPKVEQVALEMYRQFCNAWAQDGFSDGYQVSMDEFFTYDETYHRGEIDCGWYTLYIMSAGTGDDGGPANLFIWTPTEGLPGGDPENPHIEAIAQEFDTMVGFIYNHEEGGWVHWPETIPKP